MSDSDTAWLIGYDIREPRRLSRVHRFLARRALALQYSVFAWHGRSEKAGDVFDDLRSLIDERVDDVRCYHLPSRCKAWVFGSNALFPEGIWLAAPKALQALLGSAASDRDDND